MKKIIIGLIVFVVVLAFTLPLYADPPDLGDNPGKSDVALDTNVVAHWSSMFIHNGRHFGCGDPSKGARGTEIQDLLGH